MKPDIDNIFPPKTGHQITKLATKFRDQIIFGRSDVMNGLGIKASRASELLRVMLVHQVIKPVTGHGKGKYIFSGFKVIKCHPVSF
ncbi:hypothetical protein FC21_GL000594 [Limosilactobacillus equigenerosi DSM 18793 = JCM 14505]|uniref:FtsK gamma domain-containing protein n=1 Tax=Limosilactobacillus equigenerosi DSM 18793 = JCM 14505 TaxID=1423742 RepID=A0A0R1USI0_9LACO|nr:hypothetical protein FC21_GL000594 [Limosilactobacillus equigenerosi DSM 18793 = JCM 14505]